ncbi:hypothetical protein KC19_4G250900 [Ceratodon purpureus]|uniref:Uncharacterized protein n=1 Tax=Ceratodon purpureus TaxID=3225 RepID=A0A8T0ICG0_CERPU|nr:hypothetical protein KC19_4G250900 [Ceratodon purpureus]
MARKKERRERARKMMSQPTSACTEDLHTCRNIRDWIGETSIRQSSADWLGERAMERERAFWQGDQTRTMRRFAAGSVGTDVDDFARNITEIARAAASLFGSCYE